MFEKNTYIYNFRKICNLREKNFSSKLCSQNKNTRAIAVTLRKIYESFKYFDVTWDLLYKLKYEPKIILFLSRRRCAVPLY